MKTCSRCGETKELNKFYRRSDSADGRRGYCKACDNAKSRQWYERNTEYQKEHARKYYQEHQEERVEYQRQWRSENAEKHRRSTRLWREENPEKNKEMQRRWREENAEYLEEYNRQYREDNRDVLLQRSLEWQRNNPVKAKARNQRRRARKLDAPGDGVTPEDMKEILERDGHRCLACGSTEDLTFDHVIPLASGGPHDKSNLQTLCRSCNCSKQIDTTDYR